MNDIRNLNQTEIVTLVCLSLDGLKKRIHTEEIANKSHQISNHFGWTLEKYKKFPDMARVRKAIDRAKQDGWLIGGYSVKVGHDGWQVTEKGKNAVEEYISYTKVKKKMYKLTSADNKKLASIKKHSLYKSFLSNSSDFDANIYELSEMLSSISDPKHIRTKFFNFKILAEMSGKEELQEFSSQLLKKFPTLLNEKIYKEESTVRSKQREKMDL